MIRDTSLASWSEFDDDKLSDRQLDVIDAIIKAGRPVCNYELAGRLAWPINCVTPRVNELVNRGVLVDAGKRPGPPAGRDVHFWRLKNKKETLF